KYRRLYYLADTREETEKLSKDLEDLGAGYDQQHIFSNHEGELVKHNLHTASPIERYDIIHYGERGAIIGFVGGLVFVLLLELINPMGLNPGIWAALGILVLFTFFGSWAGGLVGTHRRNYRIARFLPDIKAGKYLMLVDVHGEQIKEVKDMIRKKYPDITFKGGSSTGYNPFDELPVLRSFQSD
ncbi:MAG: hypothetical protein R3208_14865, partial [Ketobacteraceae bacterium]|nr:hypothetical protein [Ketobacteraceae bacterium]